MKLRIFLAVLVVLVIIGALAGVRTLQVRAMIDAGANFVPPPVTVDVGTAETDTWERSLRSVGSVAPIDGVVVRAEVSGVIEEIAFTPGTRVAKGALLVRLDQTVEAANLRQAEADLALARRNNQRAQELFASQTVAESDLDSAAAAEAAADARMASLQATLAKKTIRAPFAGSLGIKRISLGQYVNPGDPLVDLQSLDPIYVEFSLPQREVPLLKPGLRVRATLDGVPEPFLGRITAINPLVDEATRNLRLQATFSNSNGVLRVGMYVNVDVVLPETRTVVKVPATSILYAPFGNTVFTVTEQNGQDGSQQLIAQQQIVRLGDTEGDFVEIVEGLSAGQRIVSAGAFKLQNGQAIAVSELGTIPPSTAPTPPDS